MVNVCMYVYPALHFVCLYAQYRLYNSSNCIITVCAYIYIYNRDPVFLYMHLHELIDTS